MNKAFTRESDDDEYEDGHDPLEEAVSLASTMARPNYITPGGYTRLKAELFNLIDTERPQIVDIVHWAAGNGDRSENGDYLYGKKRLREIDRRVRFLTRRLEIAKITDPSVHAGTDQVFFGATVCFEEESGIRYEVTILGIDEFNTALGEISWISPVARVLLGARVGDAMRLDRPAGQTEIEVISVCYPASA